MTRPRADRQIDLVDLRFMLHDWLRVDDLLTRERFAEHSPETVDAVVELSRDIAAERLAPLNRLTDTFPLTLRDDGEVPHPPEVRKALREVIDAGIPLAGVDARFGGLQLPYTVATACFTILQAANPSVWAYLMLTLANANLIAAHGTPEQVETYGRRLYAGDFFGTMCLSEPEVGSSLADVRTRAMIRDDGTYRLFGRKMWISGAEHDLADNIVHLVLARIDGAAAGVRGLSLFIVPKYLVDQDGSARSTPARNDIRVTGLNHKMGYRGTVNTVLSIGDGEGAVGYLVGEPGHGLTYMFHMMNEARIAVGSNAAALGYTGYLKSLAYARERLQGRRADAKDAARPVPIVEHADVKHMLLTQKAYAQGALGLVLYAARLFDESVTAPGAGERERAGLLLDLLTPIVKSWPSQYCLKANELAIQVLGGAGYTQDHDLEQHYRDNRLNAIHEGTHGIQAIDLLGRKVRLQGGAAFEALRVAVLGTVGLACEAGGQAADLASVLEGALTRLVATTRTVSSCDDPARRLADASLYLEGAGHVVVAWLLLDQFVAAGGRDDDFARGKRNVVEFFYRYELPHAAVNLDLVAGLDDLVLNTDPELL